MVELTPALAEFLIKNCDSNIGMGLAVLQDMKRRDLAKGMVDMLESFKELKKRTQAAVKEHGS